MLFDYSFEPNNTLANAVPLDAGSYDIHGNGTDWYRVDASPGQLSFVMTPAAGTDVNMVLHNALGQVVGGQFRAGTERIDYLASASGTYYLEIYPTAAATAQYSLSVGLPAGTWSKTLDLGPIRDVPVAVFDIDGDGKDEIFVATSKTLDGALNEVRPAGLAALREDGSTMWIRSFPAIAGLDPQTGKAYNTTAVSSAPTFADLNGDRTMEIIIGVGADTFGEGGAHIVSQPGDKGGVYALNADGSILWYHQTRDAIGGASNAGDGRPDGVYGAPVVFDIDGDGNKEVIVNSWDQSTWILDGATGAVEREIHLADTIWATPRVADINGDGRFEILVSADITANADARTETGGLFHVLSADGSQVTPGFDQHEGRNPAYPELRGKWEEQALWSSPVTGDIDGDGLLEIAYGTGNFFHDGRGAYIRVWEHDGTAKFRLDTQGRTLATPLMADLDGDGRPEIVAATLDGYVHAWDGSGRQLFAVQPRSFGGNGSDPIFSAPIAVDLDGDGKLEILVSKGAQTVILDHDGRQLSSATTREYIFESFKGSPAVKDIDGDGQLEIISGGTTASKDQAVVYRWDSPFNLDVEADGFINGRYQFHQSQTNIEDFVKRFYQTVLGREAEPGGRLDWVDRLATGVEAGADVARGFIFSAEFTNKGVDDATYVDILYRAFFNRAPDEAGYADWTRQLAGGAARSAVLDGFIYSQEFKNLCADYGIRPARS